MATASCSVSVPCLHLCICLSLALQYWLCCCRRGEQYIAGSDADQTNKHRCFSTLHIRAAVRAQTDCFLPDTVLALSKSPKFLPGLSTCAHQSIALALLLSILQSRIFTCDLAHECCTSANMLKTCPFDSSRSSWHVWFSVIDLPKVQSEGLPQTWKHCRSLRISSQAWPRLCESALTKAWHKLTGHAYGGPYPFELP